MKNFSILVLAFLLLSLSACRKEGIEQTRDLESSGLLGRWKHEGTEVDGISDLAVACCDYLTFGEGSDLDDLKGVFEADGVGYTTEGVFELDLEAGTIELLYSSVRKIYGIQISEESFTFRYTEDNEERVELWRREE